jgi:photosystem II stability/assembly factor-like uncharacterized protein
MPIQQFAFNGQDTMWLTTKNNHLLRSDDGGKNWVTIDLSSYGNFRAITFNSRNIGWAVNDKGQVWSTNDGGNTWELLATLNYEKDPFVGPIIEIHFIDESNGWILDPFSLWSTLDGGITWTKKWIAVKPDQVKELVYQLIPFTKDILWLRGQKNENYYTEDGGKNWEKRKIDDSHTDLNRLFFVSNKIGWVCSGPKGGIYKTQDGGNSWLRQNVDAVEPSLYSIYFIDENEGWAAGRSSIVAEDISGTTQGLLLHTVNGGNTWKRVELPGIDDYYLFVKFSTSAQGWLISKDKVYHTNDKGKSWEKVFDISNK